MALAGGLYRAAESGSNIPAIIEAIATVAGDEEAGRRREAAETTIRKAEAGEDVTGWPTLAELIDPKIVDRIIQRCYDPFFKQLLAEEKRITLNINAVLLETLESQSPYTIDRIKECVEEGLIEFLGSGAYHPIFPLLASEENRCDQIRTNFEISRRVLVCRMSPYER